MHELNNHIAASKARISLSQQSKQSIHWELDTAKVSKDQLNR